jgi:hypothetical protein
MSMLKSTVVSVAIGTALAAGAVGFGAAITTASAHADDAVLTGYIPDDLRYVTQGYVPPRPAYVADQVNSVPDHWKHVPSNASDGRGHHDHYGHYHGKKHDKHDKHDKHKKHFKHFKHDKHDKHFKHGLFAHRGHEGHHEKLGKWGYSYTAGGYKSWGGGHGKGYGHGKKGFGHGKGYGKGHGKMGYRHGKGYGRR